MLRQVSSSWKELAKEPVGVLIRSTLPRALRIAEVDLDVGRHTEPLMIRHFVTTIPSECLVEFRWQPLRLFDESIHDSFRVPTGQFGEHHKARVSFYERCDEAIV